MHEINVGILVALWRWFFGSPAIVPRNLKNDPKAEPTVSLLARVKGRPIDCFHGGCFGKADPRCGGGNCTEHCLDYCGNTCIGYDVVERNVQAMNGMGHQTFCVSVGRQHVYMCKDCGMRLSLPSWSDRVSDADRYKLMELLETCDTYKVVGVMKS
jgi:hypothetical protein